MPLPGDGGPDRPVAWATGSEVSPRLLATLTGHENPLSVVATETTADGRTVAVPGGYGESTVRVWDLATGEQIELWRPHTEDAWALTTAVLDGRPVVVTGSHGTAPAGNTIQVWDLAGGPPIGRVDSGPFPGIPDGPDSLPEDMCYPGGIYVNALASAVLDGRPVVVSTVCTDDGDADVCHDFPVAAVHDLATGRQITAIPTGHGLAVHLATAVLDGRPVLVTGSSADPEVRLWDLATGQRVGAPLTGHAKGMTVVATTTLDGRPVAVTGSYDGTVRRWDLSTGQPIGEALTWRTRDCVQDLDVTVLDGRPVVVAVADAGTVCMWDLATGRPAAEPFTARGAHALATADIDGRPVAVTAMSDATVRLWDLTPRPSVGAPVTGHSGTVTAAAFDEVDGRPVALTGGADGALRRWDLATGRPAGPPLVADERVFAVAATAVGGRPTAVTVGAGPVQWTVPFGTVRRWDLATGTPAGAPVVGIPNAYAVAATVLHGRPVAVTGGYDRTVIRRDLSTGEQIGDPLAGHDWAVQAVATTVLDGRPVAVSAGGSDRTLRLWDLDTGQQIGPPLTGHTDRVEAVAVAAADGRTIAVSGGEDHTVRLWDLADGRELLPALTGHTGAVTVLATGLIDGQLVAVSGGDDRTVRLWDLITREQIGSPLTFPEAIGALAVAPGGLIVCFGFEAAFLTGAISPLRCALR